MNKTILNLIGIAAILAIGLSAWGLWGLNNHLIAAVDSIAQTAKESQQTIPHINTSIEMMDEDIGALKSAIIHADLVARHEQQQLGKYDQLIDSTASDLHNTLTAATGTLSSTSRLADQGAADLRTLDGTIAQFSPILIHADSAVFDLDGVLKANATQIHSAFNNVTQITSNLNSVSNDASAVSDDIRMKYFEKRPWWKKIGPFAELGVKVGNKVIGF